MTQRPSFQFYPRDWMNDLELRQCSAEARCLWIDMLCIMHDGEPYGHLHTAAGDIPMRWLANRTGLTLKAIGLAMADLEKHGVFSRTEAVAAAANGTAGSTGNTIYSRRMVRDEQSRSNRATYGKLHSAEFVNQSSRQTTIVESDDITKVRIAQESRRNPACVEISASESPKTPPGSTPRSTPRSISTTNVSSSSSSSSINTNTKRERGHSEKTAVNGTEPDPEAVASPVNGSASPARPISRGSRWHEQPIPDEWVRFCTEKLQWFPQKIADVYADFSDFWIAMAGERGVKLDWLATWRRWCRNERGKPNGRPQLPLTDQKSTYAEFPIYLPAED